MTKELFNLNVLWVAHRGLSSKAIENTIDSFEMAAELPFFGIECDIHLTKDKEIIVHHDSSIKRLTNIDLLIKDATYEELLKIDFSFPTLKEYIDICKKGNKASIIEFKGLWEENNIDFVYNKIKELNHLEKTIFISFYQENLINVRKLDQNIKLQYLTGKYNEDVLKMCVTYKIDLDLYYPTITKEMADEILSNDLEINAFTVNDINEVNKLIDMGIKYITTDGIEIK